MKVLVVYILYSTRVYTYEHLTRRCRVFTTIFNMGETGLAVSGIDIAADIYTVL